MNVSQVIPLVPVYNQSYHLASIVNGLICNQFEHVIVIDDGSSERYEPVIRQFKNKCHVHLITHDKNRGKGEALKTGFRYYIKYFSKLCKGVVTLDADGQHSIEDVGKVANIMLLSETNLVLGVRSFHHRVPILNKIGNIITQKALASCFGIHVQDTQTGLRGIPNALVLDFLELATHRYDFEMDCLIRTKALGVNITQVAIETIYADSVDRSHFRKIIDSLRISLVMMRAIYKKV